MRTGRRHFESMVGPGWDVAGYTVEERLGAGGFGTVFLAHRGGRRYALKLVSLEELGEWGERELLVLARVKHPNAVRLLGHSYWPDEAPLCLVLVMEYVEGRRLDGWAQAENPSAAQTVRVVLDVARALAALHGARAVHRDVKEANILVREGSGQAVLVDFGVGGYEGAPRVTGGGLPPGTPEYRSPEAWQFQRERGQDATAQYVSGPKDDLYALGVVLYWLLTDALPFRVHDVESMEAILSRAPLAPHLRNPRVPAALGDVCMRLLEKQPETRPSAEEACALLEGLLTCADSAWGQPLREHASPADVAVTLRSAPVHHKGRTAEAGSSKASSPRDAPTEDAPWPPFLPSAAPLSEGPPQSRPPVHQALSSRWGRRALGLVALAAFGVAAAFGLQARTAGAPSPPAVMGNAPPLGSSRDGPPWQDPTQQGGWKLAYPWNLPEAGYAGLLPPGEALPGRDAPRPGIPEEKASMKSPEKKSQLRNRLKKVAVAAACTSFACAAPPREIRPPPPFDEACPPGALDAMDKFGIHEPYRADASFFIVSEPPRYITIKEGRASLRLVGKWHGLPNETIFFGKTIFADRIYGWFTQARTPNGDVFPTCVEILNGDGLRGLDPDYEGNSGTARVPSAVDLRMTRRFTAAPIRR